MGRTSLGASIQFTLVMPGPQVGRLDQMPTREQHHLTFQRRKYFSGQPRRAETSSPPCSLDQCLTASLSQQEWATTQRAQATCSPSLYYVEIDLGGLSCICIRTWPAPPAKLGPPSSPPPLASTSAFLASLSAPPSTCSTCSMLQQTSYCMWSQIPVVVSLFLTSPIPIR